MGVYLTVSLTMGCFFDPKLRYQSLESTEDCALPESVNEIYQKLKAIHAAL